MSGAGAKTEFDPRAATEKEVWRILERVPDPEIPVLSVVDLGIIRYVRSQDDGRIFVGVAPTYSGCPATEVIRALIARQLHADGLVAQVEDVLSPPWSSDWISDEGRRKLKAFGIAPPEKTVVRVRHLLAAPVVACPRCDSTQTERVSEFGSTPCKAHYRCLACAEPFDHFKCI